MKKLHTDYIKRWHLVTVAAALIALTGCSDDIGVNGNGNDYEASPSDCLAFTTRLVSGNVSSATRSTVSSLEIVEEEWTLQTNHEDSCASRGTLAYHLSGSAGVLGFQYEDENDKIPIADNGNNLEFEFDGDRLSSKSTTILWSSINKPNLNVYSYAPYVPTNPDPDYETPDGMKLNFTTAPPQIYYTVPDLIDNQTDILTASWKSTEQADPEYIGKTIPLNFNHILTAIRFRVGFDCTVKSVAIEGVYNSGHFNLLTGEWEEVGTSGSSDSSDPSVPASPSTSSYIIDFSDGEGNFVEFEKNELLTGSERDHTYMILMPQTLPADAKIVLTCVNEVVADDGTVEYADEVYTANIGRKADGTENKWEQGKLITYTFYKGSAPGTIYFDLALGNVEINANTGKYSGKIYKDGKEQTVTGTYNKENHYNFYVYQSTGANRDQIWNGDVCTPPQYANITAPDGRSWREFITNNTDVDAVIEAWDKNHTGVATAVGREATEHRIDIIGAVTCDLTIDNIFSTHQHSDPPNRSTAGITFVPIRGNSSAKNSKVTVKIVGDNRVGAVHYSNTNTGDENKNGNEIIFEGTGSLTVADVDGKMGGDGNTGLETGKKGYWSNHWSSAIGGRDNGAEQQSYGIVINSGIIFAGTTKAENCTAIGGGGNDYGMVTINGGTVTAVATTTGTAIGGGIGFGSPGGKGYVTINGGNVYAYNHANKWNIPSSAIGGAGSRSNYGEKGNVNISGGYVYAESALGTAIGGGSSQSLWGGDANVTITGGEVFAKTGSKISASIGGGTACSQPNANATHNGGNATITIYGNPIIRTGSIGGGGTGAGKGHIGNAKIYISGQPDIQAQFLLSAGTSTGNIPEFNMSGGIIRNSDTSDKNYLHVKDEGGAVYLENGKVNISGGKIQNCRATRGGAIYIEGSTDGTTNASFTMTGGFIEDNESYRATGASDEEFVGSGGAIYIIDGNVELSGGTISDNLAAGGNGGGVFIRRGSLKVSGKATEIKNNSCEIRTTDTGAYGGGNGGGIYIYSKIADVDVNIESGNITGNTADRRGGGLCVIQDESEYNINVTLGTEGGENEDLLISGNHTLLQGGGVYAKGTNANITINSGTIMDNTVSQYVHNQNVANDLGSVTLIDGNVTHNVITFNANDGSDNPETSIQKIVTETNSALKTPAFERMGFDLVGWNTKPSGAGDSYSDGDIMNIHEDITLYAQWKMWQP